MESYGADVKLKDVFDEDSEYDHGKIRLDTKYFCISQSTVYVQK